MTNPFSIQQTDREVLVWAKCWDGRKVCVLRCNQRFEAAVWIETSLKKLGTAA